VGRVSKTNKGVVDSISNAGHQEALAAQTPTVSHLTHKAGKAFSHRPGLQHRISKETREGLEVVWMATARSSLRSCSKGRGAGEDAVAAEGGITERRRN